MMPWGRRICLIIFCVVSWTAWPARVSAQPTETSQVWFQATRARIQLSLERGENALLHATATLRSPHLQVVRADSSKEGETSEVLDRGENVRDLSPLPMDVEQIAIHDGLLSFISSERPGKPLLEIHRLEVMVENFSSNRALSKGLPMLATARGRIGRSGYIEIFVTANPWGDKLDFAGRAQVVGLQLEEIAGLAEKEADLRLKSGSVAVFMEFSVQGGKLSGRAKAFLTDAEFAPADPGFLDQLKSWFVSGALEILSTEVGEKDRAAGSIPIRGNLLDPEPDLWSAIFSVVGNAFVEALAVGYGGGR